MDIQMVIVILIVAISAWVVIKKIFGATKKGACGCSGGCGGCGGTGNSEDCGEKSPTDKD